MRPCRWARTQRAEGTGQARQKSQPLWLPGDSLPKFDDQVFFFFMTVDFPVKWYLGMEVRPGRGEKGAISLKVKQREMEFLMEIN